MPRGDKTKAPSFVLWKAGKPLRQIQNTICVISPTRPRSIAGWVRDWEGGRQGKWAPTIKK